MTAERQVAPSLQEIAAAAWDLLIWCEPCRVLVQLPRPDQISADRSRPVSELRWRCRRCGQPGKPRVYGKGNTLAGRPLLWPPETAGG